MLIKKGVSIPAVALLVRHKDGGGLLLKKYTQGFERVEGDYDWGMIRSTLAVTLGFASLTYGQEGM